MTTVSAAPVASITVSLAKPGPGGSTRRWRRPSISPTETPFTSMVIGNTPPATLTGIAENCAPPERSTSIRRSEEHTSELQSHLNLVCRLLLEKKKNTTLCRPYMNEHVYIYIKP